MRRPLGIALLLASLAPPLAAQRARLEVSVPVVGQPPIVRAVDVLADKDMRDLLINGFPARLHFRGELWSVSGWFNDLERTVEWDIVVQFDAFTKSYRVLRILGEQLTALGTFADLDGASAAIASPFRLPIVPPTRRGGRFYYSASLDLETLSMSDLDELERWLRGELKPAVRGQRNPGTALTRGLRTLFVRLLGGEKRHYEAQSSTFRT